jgi:hypothetical protein
VGRAVTDNSDGIDLGTTLGVRLCEAWGLDPNQVKRITIDITANTLPAVTVELFAYDALESIITEHHVLAPRDRP